MGKSFKWIIWLPLLVSLISFSGFAKSSNLAKSISTELVDNSKAKFSNALSIILSTNRGVQKETSKHFLLRYRESLNFAATSYLIKNKVQKKSFLNSFKYYLPVINLFKTGDSDSYFII